MIDLHSHILPGVDDGSPDLETTLAMARMAVADGIEVMACTPHFMPGLYDNTVDDIRQRVDALNAELIRQDIDLALVVGCDAHIRPDFTSELRAGKILTLHDTRYFLFEPSHMVLPQRMDEVLFNITVAGFVPILTHPERLHWIDGNYDFVTQLVDSGVWIQITAGSLTGRFGRRPKYWAERMLAEGIVHILATDAHNTTSRPPLMAEAVELASQALGSEEAAHLVITRPTIVLENRLATEAPPLPERTTQPVSRKNSFFKRILKGF